MSSRKKIRQAPGRLLRQKLVTPSGVSQEWNPAFKGPETLDTALDPLQKIHSDIYAKATEGVYIPPDTSRPIDNFFQPSATIDEGATTSSTGGARQEKNSYRTYKLNS
jgi:hypothetical protein